jgi:nucleotide-binding universal stress UspA family protein
LNLSKGDAMTKEKMKILIGYDGSSCAEAALDDLQRAGLPAQAEVFILSVAEVWLPPPPPSVYEILEQAEEVHVPSDVKRVYARTSSAMKEAHELAQRARERVQGNNPLWTVNSDASNGSPAWELVAKADDWNPDLIVVGSHGRTALGRFVLGSVSQRVVTEARCSVRVARGRVDEPGLPVRIIVGLDGSPGCQVALREVASRRWPSGSEIRLIVADDPLVPSTVGSIIPPLAEMVDESNKADRDWAETMLRKSAEVLQPTGCKVITELVYGDPKHVLVKAAEDWRADCIFVGSTGFSNRFERFVLGSVSAAVVARAHCTVEVVRSQSGG